jgi:hypothetical protein
MQTGLLWFDSDPARSLSVKAEAAARRYREKFGILPNTCYINQAALGGAEMAVTLHAGASDAIVRLLPAANILPHHFWIGVEDG